MSILLSAPSHKRSNTTGLGGICYSLHAILFAPIFIEAMTELQEDDFVCARIRPHMHKRLWTPRAKCSSCCTVDGVRDIEIPNGDTKILERMHYLILDECVAPTILPKSQVFIKGGDIMHNI